MYIRMLGKFNWKLDYIQQCVGNFRRNWVYINCLASFVLNCIHKRLGSFICKELFLNCNMKYIELFGKLRNYLNFKFNFKQNCLKLLRIECFIILLILCKTILFSLNFIRNCILFEWSYKIVSRGLKTIWDSWMVYSFPKRL